MFVFIGSSTVKEFLHLFECLPALLHEQLLSLAAQLQLFICIKTVASYTQKSSSITETTKMELHVAFPHIQQLFPLCTRRACWWRPTLLQCTREVLRLRA